MNTELFFIIIGLGFLAIMVYHIYKLTKVHPLSPSDYPQMPTESFDKWKKLELESSYSFVAAVFIAWFFSIVVSGLGAGNLTRILNLFISFLSWGGIILAIIKVIQARNIKKSFQVDWRRPAQRVTTLPVAPSMELEFWQSIKDSKNPDDFNAYISTYPNGQFLELAKSRVRAFSKNSESAQPDITGQPVRQVTIRHSDLTEEKLTDDKPDLS
jgi:hypothetical protein